MFKFSQIHPGIFHLEFKDKIELTAHFLRAQEFYESPKFQGKSFQLMDFIMWYIKEGRPDEDGKDIFSYFDDWGGFNIPAEVILQCHAGITDMNDYDRFLHIIAKKALTYAPKAYIIGTSECHSSAISHEIAHGLFYTNDEYKTKALELIDKTPQDLITSIKEALVNMGYAESVLDDETQAYMSTGLCESIQESIENVERVVKTQIPFIKLFKSYTSYTTRKTAKLSIQ